MLLRGDLSMGHSAAFQITAAFVVAGSLVAKAEIRLPKVLSDHAVLQRGVPVHVWGWATPGVGVRVNLHGQTVDAVTDRLGEWSAWLGPESAGGPYTLTVKGDGGEGSVQISDLLVGDVWIASGQSNMEMPLGGFSYATNPLAVIKDGSAEIKAANHPELRLLKVENRSSDFPLEDGTRTWTECTPETAAKFSAIAYFFGREISKDEHVPIGLIDASWGGSVVDGWISMEGLSSSSAMLGAFRSRAIFNQQLTHRDEILAAEKREDDAARAAGKPAAAHGWIPPSGVWLPAGLYNGTIAPLTGYSIKGFLWYQGESDHEPYRVASYTALFEELIADWRSHFSQGDLPFVYAQISSFNGGETWAVIRDDQRRALAVSKTAMAVTLDVGEAGNVHPPDKQTVAKRMALAARGMVYGEKVAYQSPLFREATYVPGGMRVWFDHAEGLTYKESKLEGFELAGEDHHFVPAEATLEGETVVVKSAAIAYPRYVRYAFADVAPPSLYNAAGLPASTFSSEDGN
jgi:sialate O-acetylesterase